MKIDPKCVARVGHALPPPTHCRYCGQSVRLCNNEEKYGKSYGDWPYCYLCDFCGAYVGVHSGTDIPIGTMATDQLRKDRSKAHQLFDPLWRSKKVSRSMAYALLASEMKMDRDRCHISWFDREELEQVFIIAPALCKRYGIK